MKLLSIHRIPELASLGKKDALDVIRRELAVVLSQGDNMDGALELALDAMSLLFVLDKSYRKNIRGFNACYAFRSNDGKVDVGVRFKSWRFLWFHFPSMKVQSVSEKDAPVVVGFDSSKDMATFVLSKQPDVFLGILENQLFLKGNMNYILKFIYLAKHIPVALGFQPL